jgi:hypothetical protein
MANNSQRNIPYIAALPARSGGAFELEFGLSHGARILTLVIRPIHEPISTLNCVFGKTG